MEYVSGSDYWALVGSQRRMERVVATTERKQSKEEKSQYIQDCFNTNRCQLFIVSIFEVYLSDLVFQELASCVF